MPATPFPDPPDALRWDVFCQVIDNHGDAGVAWRLCQELAVRRQAVRLWIDRPDVLPEVAAAMSEPAAGVDVRVWTPIALEAQSRQGDPPQVIVECFGCPVAMSFIADCDRQLSGKGLKFLWINLEYLTAQAYAERNHALPSPVADLPPGCERFFYYPGFTPRTGGLLREANLLSRQEAFHKLPQPRNVFLRSLGLPAAAPGEQWISLFCYEPPLLPTLLLHLANRSEPTRLLVTSGRATQAVQNGMRQFPSVHGHGSLSISYLPWLSQSQYDELLWVCDLNCVRGEDSLVRALWAGQPLVWHIYPQSDDAHLPKLDAFLDWLGADATWRAFMHAWNGTGMLAPTDKLPLMDMAAWHIRARAAQTRLWAQPDLVSTLLGFAQKRLTPL